MTPAHFLAAARVRLVREIECCAAVCAYVADVPDELTPDLFHFHDTRLIFSTAVHEGIPELPRRLRAAGFWRPGPDRRDVNAMRTAMDWSTDLLLELCSWPRGNARRCAKALVEHHRATRDAAAHLARADELIEGLGIRVDTASINPFEGAVRLVELSRLTGVTVEGLVEEMDGRGTRRRVA